MEIVSSEKKLGGLRLPQVKDDTDRKKIQDQFAANDQLAGGLIIFNHSAQALQYWNGSEWVTVKELVVKNGISLSGDTIVLGGSLTKPTVIASTSANNLTISGADVTINEVPMGSGKIPDKENIVIGKNAFASNRNGDKTIAIGTDALSRNVSSSGSNIEDNPINILFN